MIKRAYAKLNLTLEIVGKKDNYHQLESIITAIDLYDELTFSESEKDIVISNIDIFDNNIYEAIKVFKKYTKINKFVKINLIKNIPIGYGLGGSSANISATLLALNEMFKTNLKEEELESLASSLGSDTVFCLYNQRSFMSGRGEKLVKVDNYNKLQFLIIIPHHSLSTKNVFANYRLNLNNYIGFKNYLKNNEYIIKYAKNDLINSASKLNNEITKIVTKMNKLGIKINLTGSGSALFVINPTNEEINLIKEEFKQYKIVLNKEI